MSTTRNLSMGRWFLFVELGSALLPIIDRSGVAWSLPLGASLLSVAGDFEDIEHAPVVLVTRVLQQLALRRTHRQQHRPRLLPGCRIADREPQLEPIGADARVSLDEMQIRRRSTVVVLAVEIRRLDDERVAFPVAAGVADPGANVVVQPRTSVERDDARFMNHLVHDDGGARCLHDPDVVVIERGQTGAWQP